MMGNIEGMSLGILKLLCCMDIFMRRKISRFLDAYQDYVRQQKHPRISDGQLENVPCQLINCFCMYSDYVPMTLDEWIEIDKQRRNIL